MSRRRHFHTPEMHRPITQFEYDRRTEHVVRKAVIKNVDIIQGLFTGLTMVDTQGLLDEDSRAEFKKWDEIHGLDFVIEPIDDDHDSKMSKAREVVGSLTQDKLAEVLAKSGEAALMLAQIVPIARLNGISSQETSLTV